jgi:hypothetical protein
MNRIGRTVEFVLLKINNREYYYLCRRHWFKLAGVAIDIFNVQGIL